MHNQRFVDKVVWITGASSGIGEACALVFAKEGASLILTGRSVEALNKVSSKCAVLGVRCAVLPYDLSDLEHLSLLVEKANNFFGPIDVLFNNAGVSQRALAGESLLSVDKKIMDINFFSAAHISKLVLPSMIANGGGTIAVTTSITGTFGFPLRSAYSASKHALYGFFESLHAEYHHKNIRVVFVCPGRVKTNISINALSQNGEQYGQMDDGQSGGISPEKAAKKIVSAIYHRKPEVLVGGKELLMVYIKRLFPGLLRKIIRKIKHT
ncbi:MAG: hypothetical protein FD155_3038 [Bacteroidetes bacterium]|nr:MAG: hypothetical protein FD155_3038 [Bacteroidota bacterium]